MREETDEERHRRIAATVWTVHRMPWSPPYLTFVDGEWIAAALAADAARGVPVPTRFDATVERYLPELAPEFRAFYGDGWNADEDDASYMRRLAERDAVEQRAWLEHLAAGSPPVALKPIRPRPPRRAPPGDRGASAGSADSAEVS